jgi:Xaa-Pro aminopeptidase
MVFELEPNACRGKYRVNIGGTVAVTEDGVEEFNKLPTELQIVG